MLKFQLKGSTPTVSGVLTGLEPSTSGGWHVHSGFSCTDTDGAGGHYFDGLGSDPWCSDCGEVVLGREGRGGGEPDDGGLHARPGGPRYVGGRTVVVHASAGTKVACGVIEPLAGAEVVKDGRIPWLFRVRDRPWYILLKRAGASLARPTPTTCLTTMRSPSRVF